MDNPKRDRKLTFFLQQYWGILLLLPALILSIVFLSLYKNYASDDTFIHLKFVQNLITSYEWSFNPGEPTFGTTSPLWVVLIAPIGSVTGNLLLVSKILGLIFFLGSIFVFYILAKRIIVNSGLTLAATAVWTLDAWSIRWGISGMETPLSLFLILLGVFTYIRERDKTSLLLLNPLIFACGALIRPEINLLFAITLIDQLIFGGSNKRRQAFLSLCLYIIVLLPWLIYAFINFGTIVPNTVLAKSGYTNPLVFPSSGQAGFFILRFLISTYVIECTVILLAIIISFTSLRELILKIKGNRYMFLFSMWLFALPASYCITRASVTSRYLLMISPFLILLSSQSLWFLWEKTRIVSSVKNLIFSLIFSGIVLQNILVTFIYILPMTAPSRHFNETLPRLIEWVAKNTPEDSVIASGEIGMLGYYSGRRIIDLVGLVTPGIHPFLKNGDIYQYLSLTKPQYLLSRELTDPRQLTFPTMLNRSRGEIPKGQFALVLSLGSSGVGVNDPGYGFDCIWKVKWQRL